MGDYDQVTSEELKKFEDLASSLGVLGCSSRNLHFNPRNYHEMTQIQMRVRYACLQQIADRDQRAEYECENPLPPRFPM